MSIYELDDPAQSRLDFVRCPISILALALLIVTGNDAQGERPSPWRVHDVSRTQPPIVPPAATLGQPPADAIVLFDGTDLRNWESTNGVPSKWRVTAGCMYPTPESGPQRSKAVFGDVQLHAEWSAPSPPKGSSQSRGNSGIYFMSKYEVQILDSFESRTYPDGHAGAVYGQNPPSVNACRPPGQWQTYDIIFRRPRFTDAGELQSPAILTVFHNGILVQDHFALWGPTNWLKSDEYSELTNKLPLMLQDHGNPVRFRNIWVRDLPEERTFRTPATAEAAAQVASETLDAYAGVYEDITVRNREARLQLLLHGRWFDLVPQSQTLFAFKHTAASVEFLPEEPRSKKLRLNLMGSVSTKQRKGKPMDEPEIQPENSPVINQSLNSADYVGLSEEVAVNKAKEESRRCRIVRRDDQSFPVTRDYRPNRVNLTVKEGVVIEAHGG